LGNHVQRQVIKRDNGIDAYHSAMTSRTRGAPQSAVAIALLSLTLILVSSAAGATITKKAAGKQYLKDVAPTNTALTTFVNEAGKWGNSTTDAQAEQDATPAIKALRKLQGELLSQSWPTKASGDVRTLYKEISHLEASLLALAGITILNDGGWLSSFDSDVTTLSSDSNLVRHDLGLSLNS
jgi:hypothetical protein